MANIPKLYTGKPAFYFTNRWYHCLAAKCGYKGANKQTMLDHTFTVHLKQKRHVCSHCGVNYNNWSQITRHMSFSRCGKPEGTACQYCGKIYHSYEGLRAHRLKVHPNTCRRYRTKDKSTKEEERKKQEDPLYLELELHVKKFGSDLNADLPTMVHVKPAYLLKGAHIFRKRRGRKKKKRPQTELECESNNNPLLGLPIESLKTKEKSHKVTTDHLATATEESILLDKETIKERIRRRCLRFSPASVPSPSLHPSNKALKAAAAATSRSPL